MSLGTVLSLVYSKISIKILLIHSILSQENNSFRNIITMNTDSYITNFGLSVMMIIHTMNHHMIGLFVFM